jgi:hypothetical protein
MYPVKRTYWFDIYKVCYKFLFLTFNGVVIDLPHQLFFLCIIPVLCTIFVVCLQFSIINLFPEH